jgi:hypothetical protein
MAKQMTYFEACETHKELETKLNDVYCDFSNYGPQESLVEQLEKCLELMKDLVAYKNKK